MAIYLYPTIDQTLRCPKRYTLERVQKKETLAPFITSELGRQVHNRIAHSLRSNKAAYEGEFRLPRRLLLNEGESAEAIMNRAYACLNHFNQHCRSWLTAFEVLAVEQKISSSVFWFGETMTLSGVVDAVIKTPDGVLLLDWKTGGMIGTDEQLKWYFGLYAMNYPEANLEARAINLFNADITVVRDFETSQAWLATKVKALLTSLGLAQQYKDKAVSGNHCHYCPYAGECDISKAKSRVLLDTFYGEVVTLA